MKVSSLRVRFIVGRTFEQPLTKLRKMDDIQIATNFMVVWLQLNGLIHSIYWAIITWDQKNTDGVCEAIWSYSARNSDCQGEINYDRKVISITTTVIFHHCLHMHVLCIQGTFLRRSRNRITLLGMEFSLEEERDVWHVRFYTGKKLRVVCDLEM